MILNANVHPRRDNRTELNVLVKPRKMLLEKTQRGTKCHRCHAEPFIQSTTMGNAVMSPMIGPSFHPDAYRDLIRLA